MTPLKILKQAVAAFEAKGCQYCLIGGHAASLYRSKARLTSDVDFAVLAEPISDSQMVGEQIIKSLELKPIAGSIPLSPNERARNSICMVSSSPSQNEVRGIIDILLPVLPWVAQAVRRARHNKIDLGFARVPVITPEDLILAKCYALNNSPDRFQDLDDLKELFSTVKDLDFDYLKFNLNELGISIPETIQKFASQMK